MMELTILSVEDCTVMQTMIERTLNIMDLQIKNYLKAKNGEEGLDLLNKHKVDLMILDMYMPGMSGREMLKQLQEKKNLKKIPVLIVSTESNEERIREYKKISDGFVHKPFTPEVLKTHIQKLMESRQLYTKI